MKSARHPAHTEAGAALTALMLDVFRANGALIAAGDRLVAPIGLTSARWQVLGSIALSDHPLPVAHLARVMGLSRQAVQRVADDLERQGLVVFAPNPHHKRAPLVMATEKGSQAFSAASDRAAPWSNGVALDLSLQDIAARRVLTTLSQRLSEPPTQ